MTTTKKKKKSLFWDFNVLQKKNLFWDFNVLQKKKNDKRKKTDIEKEGKVNLTVVKQIPNTRY